MARLRTNFVTGLVSNNPLTNSGTTLTSDALANLKAVVSPDVAVIVLDPEAKYGAPEIVYVTAHTASATSATISRGQESTSAREHIAGTRWIHGPVENDFDHGNLIGLSDDDHTIYVKADASRNITGAQTFTRTTSTDPSVKVAVSTDTQPRLQVLADGTINWGAGGSSATDTTLYRGTASQVKTDGNLSVAGGTIYVGSDCSIYRASADNLQTDDSFKTTGTLTAGAGAMLSAATNTQSLRIKVSAEAADRFVITGDGAFAWGNGTNATDTTLYRSAADTLKTDDTFVATRIDVGNNTYAFVPLGVVLPYAGSTAPNGFLLCGGQAVSRTTYSGLFALISTTYGVGDGSTTFNLPDLRGRVPGGKDDMGGSAASRLTSTTITSGAATLGNVGGAQTVTLASGEMPSHTHTMSSHTHDTAIGSHSHFAYPRINYFWYDSYTNAHRHFNNAGTFAEGPTITDGSDSGAGAAAYVSSTDVGTKTSGGPSTANTGSTPSSAATGHNNVQPTIILNYIIKF